MHILLPHTHCLLVTSLRNLVRQVTTHLEEWLGITGWVLIQMVASDN